MVETDDLAHVQCLEAEAPVPYRGAATQDLGLTGSHAPAIHLYTWWCIASPPLQQFMQVQGASEKAVGREDLHGFGNTGHIDP